MERVRVTTTARPWGRRRDSKQHQQQQREHDNQQQKLSVMHQWIDMLQRPVGSIDVVNKDMTCEIVNVNVPDHHQRMENTPIATSEAAMQEDSAKFEVMDSVAAIESNNNNNNKIGSGGCTRRMISWDDIEMRCKTHPWEVADMELDLRGRTCIHAVCAKKPPVEVIRVMMMAMATADTSSTRSCNNSFLERTDKHGRTPLAIAISSNADLDVIRMLLLPPSNSNASITQQKTSFTTQDDNNDRNDNTVTDNLVPGGACCVSVESVESMELAAAVMIPDHVGNLPLHLACAGYDPGQEELVRLLIDATPNSVGHSSCNGTTPLHVAIEGQAPVEVVKQLVHACPDAVLKKDDSGFNPLFLAIRCNANVAIIRCLVDGCPSVTSTRLSFINDAVESIHVNNNNNNNGFFPLRFAMQNLSTFSLEILECLCASKEIVLDVDRTMENTVLHDAFFDSSWPRQSPNRFTITTSTTATSIVVVRESIVELLLRTAPEVATKKSRSGQTPLSLACMKWLLIMKQRIFQQEFRSQRQQQQSTVAGGRQFEQLWRIVCRLMRAAYYLQLQNDIEHDHEEEEKNEKSVVVFDVNDDRNPTLHAAIHLPVAYDVVIHAMISFPHEAAMPDPRGQYPLELAIRRRMALPPGTSCPYGGPSIMDAFNKDRENLILKILNLHPEAAKIPDRLHDGRLPLASAALLDYSLSLDAMKALWSVNPVALETLDPVYGLYPFQLAAAEAESSSSASSSSCSDIRRTSTTILPDRMLMSPDALVLWHEKEDKIRLTCIYGMLRQTPDLMSRSVD